MYSMQVQHSQAVPDAEVSCSVVSTAGDLSSIWYHLSAQLLHVLISLLEAAQVLPASPATATVHEINSVPSAGWIYACQQPFMLLQADSPAPRSTTCTKTSA